MGCRQPNSRIEAATLSIAEGPILRALRAYTMIWRSGQLCTVMLFLLGDVMCYEFGAGMRVDERIANAFVPVRTDSSNIPKYSVLRVKCKATSRWMARFFVP